MTTEKLNALINLLEKRVNACKEDLKRYESNGLETLMPRVEGELHAYTTALKDIKWAFEN